MATDVQVENTLCSAFETLSIIKTKTVDGESVTNVSWPNEFFDKSIWNEEGWYEVDILPGVPVQAELGGNGRNRWVGIFQVTVCVPLNFGKDMANARYSAIAELFPRGAVFSEVEIVRVHRCPNFVSEQEGVSVDHYRLPVRIEYRADIEN